MEKFKGLLERENKKRFLDLGTGRGSFINLINSLYSDYDEFIGIDTSENVIKMASESNKLEKVEFEVMDATETDFEDSSFDVICLSNSIHHIPNITPIFTEMKRLLKSDGFIVINEMIADELDEKQTSHKLLHHFAAKLDRINEIFHDETYERKELIDILKSSPFTIADTWDLEFPEQPAPTEDELEGLITTVDRLLDRMSEDIKEKYQDEGEEIKKYIKENSFSGATSVLTILKHS